MHGYCRGWILVNYKYRTWLKVRYKESTGLWASYRESTGPLYQSSVSVSSCWACKYTTHKKSRHTYCLQCSAVLCNALYYSAVMCSALHYSSVQCSEVQYSVMIHLPGHVSKWCLTKHVTALSEGGGRPMCQRREISCTKIDRWNKIQSCISGGLTCQLTKHITD